MTTRLDYSTLRIGFGDSDITGTVLCDAICSFFRKECGKERKKNVIEISNRYFDAKVVLEELEESDSMSDKEDGIILAFVDESGTNPIPFDTLTKVHQRAEDVGQCGDLLRLCVGITFVSVDDTRQKKQYEEEYSRRVLWCLDRGYEYVEADLSEKGQMTGHDLREKDGFARIIEAIQGTVWSSSVRKTPSKTNHVTEEKKAMTNPPCNQRDETTNQKITEEDSKSISTTQSTDDNKIRMVQSEDNKQEILIDEFEQVMKEASKIRSASKSGQLTDEERRQRAGDAASALMGLLDRMGFDEDDDEYIDSSDDDTDQKKK